MEDMLCETCVFNTYDEYDDCYYCEAGLDEDDVARMSYKQYKGCPYYRLYDEYAIVRHQN